LYLCALFRGALACLMNLVHNLREPSTTKVARRHHHPNTLQRVLICHAVRSQEHEAESKAAILRMLYIAMIECLPRV